MNEDNFKIISEQVIQRVNKTIIDYQNFLNKTSINEEMTKYEQSIKLITIIESSKQLLQQLNENECEHVKALLEITTKLIRNSIESATILIKK